MVQVLRWFACCLVLPVPTVQIPSGMLDEAWEQSPRRPGNRTGLSIDGVLPQSPAWAGYLNLSGQVSLGTQSNDTEAYSDLRSERRGYRGLGAKADLDNHANQVNPNNRRYRKGRGMDPPWASQGGAAAPAGGVPMDSGRRRTGGFGSLGAKADLDNRANQLNDNNWRYWSSRGLRPPWFHSRCQIFGGMRLGEDSAGGGMISDEVFMDQCMCKPLQEDPACGGDCLDQLARRCEAHVWYRDLEIGLWVIITISWCAGHVSFACIYRRKVMGEKAKLSLAQSQTPGVFGTTIAEEMSRARNVILCMPSRSEDASLCLHSCCCINARRADTYSSAGLCSFWLVCALYFLVYWTAHGPLNSNICVALMFFLQRRMLRLRLGARSSAFILDDVAASLFCWPCATCQEARHVDRLQGVRVACCCWLVPNPEIEEPLVGGPVRAPLQNVVQPL